MCIRDRTMSLRSKNLKIGRLSANKLSLIHISMRLRSINLKIGRLSGNKCVIFEPRTATGSLRTSNKVPFAPSHRPLQDSVVINQNRPTDYEPAIKNPKNWSIIL